MSTKSGSFTANDPDGDTLSASVIINGASYAVNAVGTTTITTDYGTFTITPSAVGSNVTYNYTYTLNNEDYGNADSLKQGEVHTDSIVVSITDGINTSITQPINVIIEGNCEFGDNVEIGAGCIIKNTKIAAGTKVQPYSIFDHAVVGADAQIGPFSRLRPGAKLADEVHIGNFVEVKNSSIGLGSKANHFTYLGDAEVGAGSNIGAGTITCNYDGANKFKTIIGDSAFIGSNSSLVAPVNIGNGATVGAGSVITRDVAENSLAFERSKQVAKENYQRPEKVKK